MKDTLYIWHHLGIGDTFICNGIVRHYAKLYKNIYLFYRYPYKEKTKRLYSDLNNIYLIDGGTHEDSLAKIWEMTHPSSLLLKIRIDRLPNDKTFDQVFYEQAKLPFEMKWSNFYFKRDLEKEKKVFYDILGLKDNEDFIFVHAATRDHIDLIPKNISEKIKIIRPSDQSIDIYDFLYTIEKAKEVHMMNSSFLCLIDCIQLRNDNLFYHKYLRPDSDQILKLNWKILE